MTVEVFDLVQCFQNFEQFSTRLGRRPGGSRVYCGQASLPSGCKYWGRLAECQSPYSFHEDPKTSHPTAAFTQEPVISLGEEG